MATAAPRSAIYWHANQQVPVIPGTLITLVALPHAIRVYYGKKSPINFLVVLQWLLFFTGDAAMWVGIFWAEVNAPDPLYLFRKVHFLATECGTVVMTVCGLFKMRIFKALYPRVPERLPLALAAVTVIIFIVSASDYIYGIAVGYLTPFIVLRTLPFVWALALDTVVSASLIATVVSIDFQFAAATTATPNTDPAIRETDTGAIQIHVTGSSWSLSIG
ncbi:hypothetical protein AMAG_07683 [Allomyces macrogynus ATCC 38327]|uniref:Uncharacterized protein n=1 Tax=Allomyces macrogynus (strain ATCC 38327) TaxID=578462 RepID=A0A0L0SJ03_ALLM3|nr:hypothetical protein AMAG_07683 [Allomyces macrogynus ATCC 38327]|eukprot:KNE62466.1 hypothetical protein AMAG_07683 [Allomyces macrogynus ATCC 38327]